MDYINTSNLEILKLQLKDAEQEPACAEKLVHSKRVKAEGLSSQTPELPTQLNTSEITQPETPPIRSIPDFNNCSDAELRQWLISTAPILEQLVIIAKRFCSIENLTPEPSPCDTCSKRGQCKEPCNQLSDLLSGLYEGKGRHENLTGFHPDTLRAKERVRQEDIFEKYKSWKEYFTKYQWPVIEMYYGQCMTEKEIARKIGKSRSTVNGLLNRAKKIKEKRDEKLRRETREQIKKMEESDES